MSGDERILAAGAIEEETDRILASKEFDASERNRRFLRYVVEETVAGRAGRIKAYSIATAVFNRDDSFDPQTDPIIRIEASRLRRSLERYYLTDGRLDPIRITIPKGSYIPQFGTPEADTGETAPSIPEAPAAAGPPGADRPRMGKHRTALAVLLAVLATSAAVIWGGRIGPFADTPRAAMAASHRPAIFVAPLETDENLSMRPDPSRGFTREIINGLTQLDSVAVYGQVTSMSAAEPLDFHKLSSDLGVDYVLMGGVSLAQDSVTLTASLVEAQSGRYLWSQKFTDSLGAAGMSKTRRDVAAQVVETLTRPYGAIFSVKGKPSISRDCAPGTCASPAAMPGSPPSDQALNMSYRLRTDLRN
jgi:TolB-like protein